MLAVAACILTFCGTMIEGLGLGPKELPPQKIRPAYKVRPSLCIMCPLCSESIGILRHHAVDIPESRRCQSFLHFVLQKDFHLPALQGSLQCVDSCDLCMDNGIVYCKPRFSNHRLCSLVNESQIESLNSWNSIGFWNTKLLDYSSFNLSMAVLDFAFDILILILPVPAVYQLNMDARKKAYLTAVFSLGSMYVLAANV